MKLYEHVEDLELTMKIAGGESTIHPLLLWDDENGATLVDTGMPGQRAAIEEKLRPLGLGLEDIRRVILTHQDLDHTGSAPEIVGATGAEVFAHADDVPYIQGERRPIKMDPARVERMVESLPKEEAERVRAVFSTPPKVKVGHVLRDAEEIDLYGGITVVHTPGHTPGHVSLFLKRHRLLISGDALRIEQGTLVGPSPQATPDMPTAVASLRKLAVLPVDRVICYHGGLSPVGQSERIRTLASQG